MKYILLPACLILFSITAFGQMKPEDTEVWDPEPAKIIPGTGNKPPSDAIILFDGRNLDEWKIESDTKWEINDGVLSIIPSEERKQEAVNISTKRSFGDVQLHIEWKIPAVISGSGQRRGNSGIFFQGRYELQILDNYDNRTYANGQAASVYKQSIPLVNACRKPGEWQEYDIVFMAPVFSESGKLEKAGTITVFHNGVLVQYATEIKGSIKYIGLPVYEAHPEMQPIELQDHGSAVSFRNIWLREL